jgi:hypothetical protein
MPDTMFSAITMTPAGLSVSGTYDPKLSAGQTIVGRAFVGFLLIQNDPNNNNYPTRILDGVAFWDYMPPDPTGKYPDWGTIVEPDEVAKSGIVANLPVRAIGYAVQNVDYAPEMPKVPPGIQIFNWCVPMTVT